MFIHLYLFVFNCSVYICIHLYSMYCNIFVFIFNDLYLSCIHLYLFVFIFISFYLQSDISKNRAPIPHSYTKKISPKPINTNTSTKPMFNLIMPPPNIQTMGAFIPTNDAFNLHLNQPQQIQPLQQPPPTNLSSNLNPANLSSNWTSYNNPSNLNPSNVASTISTTSSNPPNFGNQIISPLYQSTPPNVHSNPGGITYKCPTSFHVLPFNVLKTPICYKNKLGSLQQNTIPLS